MKHYSKSEIQRAVEEVVAAGMEEFLYQEPVSSKRSDRSSTSKERGAK